MIEKDDFEAWRAHPVTEAFYKTLIGLADSYELQFNQAAWDSCVTGASSITPMALMKLKTRSETAYELSEITYEQMSEMLDDKEPERHSAD